MASAPARRKQVALGLVGGGPAWDESYRAAVRGQAGRLAIRGVYNAVPARAEQIARDYRAEATTSLTSLFERTDLDAVLVMETAWHGWFALELACRFRKPTLVVGPWGEEFSRLEQVHLTARDAGVLLMAAFPRRHTPATNRLRELMATKLGPAHSVVANISWPETQAGEQLVGLIDWCSSLLGRHPTGITSHVLPDNAAARRIELQFPASNLSAKLILTAAEGAPGLESLRIDCRQGAAEIAGDADIAWQIGAESLREQLATDRSSTELILDQFCRRVVGGLVPVSDLGDVLRSVRLAREILG